MRTRSVLVVDSDAGLARRTTHTLKKLGYAVLGHARPGVDAVRKARESAPDLVLLNTCDDVSDAAHGWSAKLGCAVVYRSGELAADLQAAASIGSVPIERRTFSLTAMANEVVDALRASSPERAAEFFIEEALLVHADPTLTVTLLEQLLGNAWKFSSARALARIAIRRELVNGVWSFTVSDNGIGFDAGEARQLFASYGRLPNAAQFAGTGRGLAVVQQIVRRHGGSVGASGAAGFGAEFSFDLGA